MSFFDFVFKPVEMILNWDNNRQNRSMQWDINEQNVALQREAWSREDQAVQRRAADLKSAGMNPILAAGTGANSMGPVKLDAPRGEQVHMGQVAIAEAAMNMMRMRDDFATSRKQRELLDAQVDKTYAEADNIRTTEGFSLESWDLRLEELTNKVALQGEQQVLLGLQQENLELRNRYQESENVIRQIDAVVHEEVVNKGLTQQELEIIRLEIENYIRSRDDALREEIGVPRDGTIYEKGVHWMRKQTNDVADRLLSSRVAPIRFLGQGLENVLEATGNRR